MSAPAQNPPRLAASAGRLRLALTALLASLTLVLIAERLGYAGVYRGPGLGPPDFMGRLGVQLVLSAPAIVYLWGLWELRRAAGAVAQGVPFADTVARALRRVGICLLAGAGLTLGVIPLMSRLFGQPYPRLIDFDVTTVMIAGLGLGFIGFAKLVEHARVVQAELNEMF